MCQGKFSLARALAGSASLCVSAITPRLPPASSDEYRLAKVRLAAPQLPTINITSRATNASNTTEDRASARHSISGSQPPERGKPAAATAT